MSADWSSDLVSGAVSAMSAVSLLWAFGVLALEPSAPEESAKVDVLVSGARWGGGWQTSESQQVGYEVFVGKGSCVCF